LLRGLAACVEPQQLTVVVNTGDDEEFYGLHVSPDVDTVLYTLAGLAPVERGWGIAKDSFHCLNALQRYYGRPWFRLGDRDLATHIFRTEGLRRGRTLTQITHAQAQALGVRNSVLPMSNQRVRTFVKTRESGWLPFQRYLILHSATESVEKIQFRGVEKARPTRKVLEAVREADWIVLPPSNPFVSLGPILALPGIRSLLRQRRERVIAVSPIVGGKPVKGPLHKMLTGLGYQVSAAAVAELLHDVAATFVLDRRDAAEARRIAELGMRPLIADTWMRNAGHSTRLARWLLERTRT